MSDKAKTVVDPAGIFSGTSTTQSLLNPIGQGVKKLTGSNILERAADPIGILKPPPGPDTSGISGAQAQQSSLIAQQGAAEKRRVAEATGEVKRREALLKRGGSGRSLLIRTSPTGVQASKNLGGAV